MSLLVVGILGRGPVDVDTPVAAADDAGLTRGDGCFEGCRIRRLPSAAPATAAHPPAALDSLDAHLARMARSAAALEIAFDEAPWRELIAEAGAAWAVGYPAATEAAVKLVLTRGRPGSPEPTGFLTVSPLSEELLRQRREGITVITLARGTAAEAFAGAPWLLGGVKTLSYAVNMAAQREAARRGADDAVYVSSDGWVLESPTSSLVWALDGTLYSVPTGANGILASTTLHLLFTRAAAAGRRCEFAPARVGDLLAAEVVVSLSSVRGPVQVVTVDGRPQRANAAGIEALTACRVLTDFAAVASGPVPAAVAG